MKTKWPKTAFILVFSGGCLANMLAGLFPANSDTGEKLDEKLGGIRWTTGTMQKWGMFHTIPTLHRVGFTIVAKDVDGNGRRYGVGLPGLREIVPREEIRYHYTFLRIFDSEPEYLEPYVKAVAGELASADPKLVEFFVVVEFEFTRHLYHIRKDGQLTMDVEKSFGPYSLEDA